jgi:hypothetical protein
MTRDELQACTKKQLIEMARERGLPGWHGMTKDKLVAALTKPSSNAKSSSQPSSKPHARRRQTAPLQTAAARDTSSSASGEEVVETSKYNVGVPTKDLSAKVPKDLPSGYGKDRIVAMVRDPYWLHCYWELTPRAIQCAEAALGQEWHTAKPTLRLLHVTGRDVGTGSETVVRDVEIHGGCNNWYLDVVNPPCSYRVDIGYLARSGKFYVLARSNIVTTPRAGISDVIDENWADIDAKKADRIFAMSSGFDATASSLELKQIFEEHLRRPLGSPTLASFGSGGMTLGGKPRSFWFQLDAELIIYGATEPNARVTLQGQPVHLRPDGTFTMRFSLPDGRQIIPSIAVSPDGVEERTVVLALERNTRQLEPLIHDGNE